MGLCSINKLRARIWGILVASVILVTLAACGGEATSVPAVPGSETGTPIPDTSPTQIPAPTPVVAPSPTSTAPKVRITPGPTPLSAATEPTGDPMMPPDRPAPLALELLAPLDGAGVETGALRVLGQTRIDAVVAINGVPAEVSADGRITQDISLEEGINLIEVTATNLMGDTVAEQAMVFFIAPAAGLPFSLFYPTDGLNTVEPAIPLFGGTRADAVVGVNGIPVEVNAQGIFSTTVTLEEGANFIEVVATDLQGNVRFQTVAVFYLP